MPLNYIEEAGMRLRMVGLALLFCAQATLVGAGERTFPITTKDANCAARQLARAQRRLTSVGAGQIATSLGTTALWTSTRAGGGFTGLARLRDLGGNGYNDFITGHEHFAEADLAFDLLFTRAQSRLDPHQPPAPQATLVRRDPGTNLVLDHDVENTGAPPGCCISTDTSCTFDLSCPMVVNFDLAATPRDSVKPAVPLLINNAAAATPELSGPLAQFLPASSGIGPGVIVDQLDQACGGRLTDFDAHVFEILARTLAPSNCYFTGPSDCQNFGYGLEAFNLAIFRATDPHTYRVDIYVVDYLCDGDDCYDTAGPVALEFRVDWDTQGRLTAGDVDVLPACRGDETTDCSSPLVLNGTFGIFILPPIFPGHEEASEAAFRAAPYLYPTSDRSRQVLSAKVNWKALLKGSALNQPWK